MTSQTIPLRAVLLFVAFATAADVQAMRQMELDPKAVIVPMGVVYRDLTIRPPREGLRMDYLWEPRGIHQNLPGTAVNAWTLCATLTGRFPADLDRAPVKDPPAWIGHEIDPEDTALFKDAQLRRALQERVWKVVRQWKRRSTEFDAPGTAADERPAQ